MPALAARVRRRHGMLASRRLLSGAGFLGTAASMLLLPVAAAHAPWLSTACFSAALMGTGLHAEGFRANYLDVTHAHLGLVSGVGNLIGSAAAMAAPLGVGAVLHVSGGSWAPVWLALGAASAAAAAAFGIFSSVTRIEDERSMARKAE